jgi:hypothetical protein
MYDIRNAFLEQFIPLLDNVNGLFRMMPPELLHTSGSELIMLMFESLRYHLGGGIDCDYVRLASYRTPTLCIARPSICAMRATMPTSIA